MKRHIDAPPETTPTPCPTGKRMIHSERYARRLLARIWSRPRPGRRLETRTYRCEHCGCWHLTSKPARANGST